MDIITLYATHMCMSMGNRITVVHISSIKRKIPTKKLHPDTSRKAYNQELPDQREKARMSSISTNGTYLA